MKKVLLSLLAITTFVLANAQIVVRGVSPASIANNFDFTWADPGEEIGQVPTLTNQIRSLKIH